MVNTDQYRNLFGGPQETDPPGLYNAIQVIRILCDEIDAARAELASARQANLDMTAMVTKLAGERDAARAELARLQARLDAVIAVCDEAEERALQAQFRDLDNEKCRRNAMVWGVKVRAAATGDTNA